jgi:pimeloyl-ACP methyl ester carboxylesterase
MNLKTVKLYHKIYGEGKPIIILHGLFGMSDNWLSFAKLKAQHRMVVLVDVRDHGRSPHTEEFTYEHIAEDVLELMHDNWIYHADIIGHSMGGKAVMQLASLHPDAIEKMAIIDIGPGSYPGGHEIIMEALSGIDLKSMTSRNEVESRLSTIIKDTAVLNFLLKNLSRNKGGGFRWKMNLPLLKSNYQQILAGLDLNHIENPTLFVKGELSAYIDDRQEALIKETFTDYSIHEIKKAGHWVHADQPQVLFDVLYDFLNDKKD